MTNHRSIRASLGAGVVLAMTASLVGGIAIAQSPMPSDAPASPAAASPAGSPATNPSTAPVDPAVAACDAILTSDSIASVTGAMVTGATPSMVGGGNFPQSPSCHWTLSDGSTVVVDTVMDVAGYGDPIEIQKALAFGGKRVKSLPQPAAEVVYEGEGNLFVARSGPLLQETLVFKARTADGKADDLALLEHLAAASTAQPAPPLATDEECAGHLGVPVVAAERRTGQTYASDEDNLYCGYVFGDGAMARLAFEWLTPEVMPSCCTKIKELGKGAYGQQSGSGKKAEWELQWVLRKGDPAIVATLSNASGGSRQLSKQELIALAKTVTLGTFGTPASATPPPSGGGASAEAAAILGTWKFLGGEQGLAVPAGLNVTLTFGTDGSALMAFDCKPPKNKQSLSWAGAYTADATTLDVDWGDRFKGDCKEPEAANFSQPMSFILGMVTHPGGWEVVGDTLNLIGTQGPVSGAKLPFQRVTP